MAGAQKFWERHAEMCGGRLCRHRWQGARAERGPTTYSIAGQGYSSSNVLMEKQTILVALSLHGACFEVWDAEFRVVEKSGDIDIERHV